MRWDLWIQLPNGTLSLSPVDVNWCQKLNHEFQSSLVGLCKGNLNIDSAIVPPRLKTKFVRYRPSAVEISDRNIIAFSAPLHLPRTLIIAGRKPSAWKISIMTWSLSRGRGIVEKAIWRCISSVVMTAEASLPKIMVRWSLSRVHILSQAKVGVCMLSKWCDLGDVHSAFYVYVSICVLCL